MTGSAWVTALLSAAVGATAFAVPVIDVGDHVLAADTPGQTVTIFVSGTDQVEGLNLLVLIGEYGIPGPLITDIDVVNGTIFAANHNAPSITIPLPDQAAELSMTTVSGSVTANGVLATLTVDTTGFTEAQSWPLRMAGMTVFGEPVPDTNFAPFPAQITNGTITVAVPEPGVVMGLAAASLSALALRKRKSVRA